VGVGNPVLVGAGKPDPPARRINAGTRAKTAVEMKMGSIRKYLRSCTLWPPPTSINPSVSQLTEWSVSFFNPKVTRLSFFEASVIIKK
jgi:hypothetical protein